MSDIEKPQTYELKEIDINDIPEIPGQSKNPSVYQKIIAEFVDSGKAAVFLNLDWPEGATYGDIESYANGLRYAVNKELYPVKVIMRQGELYLMRHDLDSQDPPREDENPEPSLSINDLDKPLDDLDVQVSVRLWNRMKAIGVNNLRELFALTDRELLSTKNLGAVTLNEIWRLKKRCGLPASTNESNDAELKRNPGYRIAS